jgi:hypothetical protein
MNRVGSLVAQAITPICQQNGFIQARIVLEWHHIVSPQFAQICTPVKIQFPWPQRHNGCLHLRTTSSMAVQIPYEEPLIVSKVNQYFGYQAVSSIKILHDWPLVPKNPPRKPAQAPLSEEMQASLEHEVQLIEDEELRAALLSLGKGIAQAKGRA